MRILQQNSRGFTLVEIMVAMVITLVALMGLLEAMTLVGQRNLENLQRGEAVHVAEEWMSRFRLIPFDTIATCTTDPGGCDGGVYTYPVVTAQSKLRGGTGTYRVTRTTVVSANSEQIDIGVNVQWKYKNKGYSHEVHTIRGNLTAY